MTNKKVSQVSEVSKVPKAFGTFGTFPFFGTSPRGFTLIEILIVIVLIGVLSTIGLETFQSAQKKGRDAQRKSDLSQVQKALELYYNDKNQYPGSNPDGKIMVPYDTTGCTDAEFSAAYFSVRGRDDTYNAACDANGDGVINPSDTVARAGRVALVWGVSPFNTGGTLYIKKLPSDPVGTLQYCYKSNGSKYQLFAKLENASDPDVVSGISCAGQTYNFRVSSPNTSPTESI